MVRRDAPPQDITSFCERCKKVTYLDRAGARRAKRRQKQYGNMSIYPCPYNEQLFHVGHLPSSVRNGTRTKDSFTEGVRKSKGL